MEDHCQQIAGWLLHSPGLQQRMIRWLHKPRNHQLHRLQVGLDRTELEPL